MTRKLVYEMLEKLEKGEVMKPDVMDAVDALLSASNGAKPIVSVSLPPLDDETAATPIQDALYATGKFSTDDCSNLADGILQYIKDAKMSIVGRQ